MPDDADKAQEHMEAEQRIRSMYAPKVDLPRTGFCHYCEEPVGPMAAFCNKECSDDYERYVRPRNAGR